MNIIDAYVGTLNEHERKADYEESELILYRYLLLVEDGAYFLTVSVAPARDVSSATHACQFLHVPILHVPMAAHVAAHVFYIYGYGYR